MDRAYLRERLEEVERLTNELRSALRKEGLAAGEAPAILEACREFFRLYPQHADTLARTIREMVPR